MTFVDEESIKRLEKENNRRQKWLEENIEVIPDPKTVTLYDFKVEWEQWSGTVMLKCDDKPCSREFYFQDNGAKVFAFKTSDTATTDTVLGIKVKYNTINIMLPPTCLFYYFQEILTLYHNNSLSS